MKLGEPTEVLILVFAGIDVTGLSVYLSRVRDI